MVERMQYNIHSNTIDFNKQIQRFKLNIHQNTANSYLVDVSVAIRDLHYQKKKLDQPWRRGFRRFNEPGPPSSWGPRVVGPQKIFRQDS